MRPSPARAQAPEPRAWLPLVDLADLPALEELLAPDRLVDSGQTRALQGHDVARWAGRPSPARAQAPEPRAWLPLVDLADLPALEELLAPDRLVDSGQTRALRDLRELDDPALVPRPVPAVPPLRRPGADEGAGEPAAGPEPPPGVDPAAGSAPSLHRTRAEIRRARRSRRLRHCVVAGLAALALAGGFAVVGRTVGHQHEVTVSADGKELSRITGADTVGAVLASAGVWVGPFDRVEPGPETPLRDGLEIAVRRAVPVVVEVDGEARTVMTASGTVTDLRAELGLPRRLAERTGPETLGPGATVVLRTPHAVTLVVDGSVRALDTTALTVAELLEDEGVTLGEEDEVVPAPTERLAGRSVVSVTRVESGLRTREVAVPFATRRVEDPSLALGRTEVVQTGRTGVERIVSLATVHDGELVSDEVVTTVTVEEPVDQVVRVGTRPAAPAPSGSGSRVETGQATWYEITPGTCAHKTIPKGTVVKVTNLQTGAWTTCVVADRGPYAAGRIIDLSHTTFAELAPRSTGVIPVRIEW